MDVLGPTPSCALYNYSCWFWFIFFCSSAVVCSQPATTRKSISLVPSCKAFCCPSGGGKALIRHCKCLEANCYADKATPSEPNAQIPPVPLQVQNVTHDKKHVKPCSFLS